MRKLLTKVIILQMLSFPLAIISLPSFAKIAAVERQITSMTDSRKFDATKILVKKKHQIAESRGKISLDYSEEKISHSESRLAQDSSDQRKVVDALRTALSDPDNAEAQPNYLYEAAAWASTLTEAYPSDYNFSNHWYYTAAELTKLWKNQGCPGTGCGGDSSIVVAQIDSGVSYEAFDDTLGQTGANFIVNSEYDDLNLFQNAIELPNNGLDDDCNGAVDDYNGLDTYAVIQIGVATCTGMVPDAVGPEFFKAGHAVDTYGHGTVVMGHIASEVDNGNSVSPAFNVSIMPIAANVHFSPYFTSQTMTMALNYARDRSVDVVSMSIAGGYDPMVEAAVADVISSGSLVVAAAGNSDSATPYYPAAYPGVISVAASDPDNTRTSYSNYGGTIDISAYVGSGPPSAGTATWQSSLNCYGTCDLNTVDDGQMNMFALGTSMATGEVAAVIAVIKSKNPTLNNTQIQDVLFGSATDVYSPGWDNQSGWGIANFNRAWIMTPPVGTSPVYRFWSDTKLAHFYTISDIEKNFVVANYPPPTWKYERLAFAAHQSNDPGTSAVYRFWSDVLQSHFYTIDTVERDYVIATYPTIWTYEGTAYNAFTTMAPGTTALYRFWSDTLQSHFYTASTAERDYVDLYYPENVWHLEGVAYYVYPLQ